MLHDHDGRDNDRQPGQGQYATSPIPAWDSPRQSLGRYPPLWQDPEDPYRFRDVLNALIAEVFEVERKLIPDVFLDRSRDADATRVRETLQPRGDIDAIAIDL